MDYSELIQNANRHNPFMTHNGMAVTAIGDGTASVAADITELSCNPYHAAHGGFLFTLADCATGCAAHSDGRRHVTLSSSMNFLRMAQSGTVVASASVTKRGKTVSVVEVSLDCEGQCLASGSFTYFCLD